MPERVRITDVSPRDGLQNEPGVVAAPDKARLIAMLAGAGVDEIEAASFVSPKWIPQLADAEQVLSLVARDEVVARRVSAGMVMSALVPNEAGFRRMEAVNATIAAEGGPARLVSKASVFTAASETFSKKNTNATIAETIARFRAFVPDALGKGYALRAYISCAIACPFEGPIAPGAVRTVADLLLALAPRPERVELDLGDTIGVARVADVIALLSVFSAAERGRLTLHLHDTTGRAGECARAALEMGVRSFDGAAGGLGGCPYASTTPGTRAPGNLATETLVRVVRNAGFETGVDGDALGAAGAFAMSIAGAARKRSEGAGA